jgi:hypothetical protein
MRPDAQQAPQTHNSQEEAVPKEHRLGLNLVDLLQVVNDRDGDAFTSEA